LSALLLRRPRATGRQSTAASCTTSLPAGRCAKKEGGEEEDDGGAAGPAPAAGAAKKAVRSAPTLRNALRGVVRGVVAGEDAKLLPPLPPLPLPFREEGVDEREDEGVDDGRPSMSRASSSAAAPKS
jgi:hypothetical protein